MKLSAIYQIFLDCQSVTTDSRNCPDGSLFIALKGESFNGNAFAGKALEDGCAFAIIDEAQYAIEGDRRYILVNDCLQTLQQLANYHRRQLGTRVIGITGTNGKTTTKELISAVLSQTHNILYTQDFHPYRIPLHSFSNVCNAVPFGCIFRESKNSRIVALSGSPYMNQPGNFRSGKPVSSPSSANRPAYKSLWKGRDGVWRREGKAFLQKSFPSLPQYF